MISINVPKCSERKCTNYIGMRELVEGDESSHKYICVAFIFEIPDEIAYGDELHVNPLWKQHNDIVYEEEA